MILGDLPPSSERDLLQIAGSSLHHQLSDLGRAREGNLVDVPMRGQGCSCSLAITGHNIDHARRKAGFRDQFAETQGRERRLFCRLQHHGATRGQSRTQFPGRHQQWKVPRNNLPDHADRLSQGVSKIIRTKLTGGNGLSFDFGCPARHVTEQIDGQRHIRDAGDRKRLSVIKGLDLGKFFQVFFDQDLRASRSVCHADRGSGAAMLLLQRHVARL